jgi:predicted chitinase
MIQITPVEWKKFAPGCPALYSNALFGNLQLLADAGILNNERRWCHFAATVYHETGNFREIRENLSYKTPSVLRRTWPSRFGKKSDSELAPLLGNPKVLAESVYGGRMGNRRGTSDAYDYRGGGWFNTTGREAVTEYCAKIGVPLSPDALDDPVLTLRFAVFEWTETKCNKWADENDTRKVAKAINTGSATSNIVPIGMADREAAFDRAWKVWGDAIHVDVVDDPPVADVVVPAVPVTKINVAAKSWSVRSGIVALFTSIATTFQSVTDWLGGGVTWLFHYLGDLIQTILSILPDAAGAGQASVAALQSLGSMIGHNLKYGLAAIGIVATLNFIWRHVDFKTATLRKSGE